MNWTKATNEQLQVITDHDHECPSSLLEGVALEMVKRHLWDSIIIYAGKQAYRNLNYTLKYGLKMDRSELIHIGHIEIMRVVKYFKTGMRTFKTYVIMCLIAKFKKLKRDNEAEIRRANIGTKEVDRLDEKVTSNLFRSPVNVERAVINKIMLEESIGCLRAVERRAIALDLLGYSQYEIASLLGYKSVTHGNTLLKRAYAKLRKRMGA